MIKLKIYGDPVPAGRPRFGNGRAHDPAKSRSYKQFVALMARRQYHGPLLKDEPIEVCLEVYRPNQKKISQIERQRRETKQSVPIKKPDTDNYIKSVLDALTGIIWADDNIIYHIDAYKYYSDKPRIELKIQTKLEAES